MNSDKKHGCPICNREPIPCDASVVEELGRRVVVQGRVNALIPPGYTYSPYKHMATVPLYPSPCKFVVYAKFRTQQEQERWGFVIKFKYDVKGCLHIVDNKKLLFDVTVVELSKE